MVGAFRVSGESSWRLLPAVRWVPVPRGGVSHPRGRVLGGDLPSAGGAGQTGGAQLSQVDPAGAEFEPGIVLGDAAVAEFAGAAGEPGDAPFHHGSVFLVIGSHLRVAVPAGPVRTQELIVDVHGDRTPGRGGGAAITERASSAGGPEFRGACLGGERRGVPGRAGHRRCLVVDGEVVDAEPAGKVRGTRPRLDHRVVTGLLQVGQQVSPVPYAESAST